MSRRNRDMRINMRDDEGSDDVSASPVHVRLHQPSFVHPGPNDRKGARKSAFEDSVFALHSQLFQERLRRTLALQGVLPD